jgi:hypothetical protein
VHEASTHGACNLETTPTEIVVWSPTLYGPLAFGQKLSIVKMVGSGLREVALHSEDGGTWGRPRLSTKFPRQELALARASDEGLQQGPMEGACSHPSPSPSFPIAVLLRSLNFRCYCGGFFVISFLLHPILRLPYVCDVVDSLTL